MVSYPFAATAAVATLCDPLTVAHQAPCSWDFLGKNTEDIPIPFSKVFPTKDQT